MNALINLVKKSSEVNPVSLPINKIDGILVKPKIHIRRAALTDDKCVILHCILVINSVHFLDNDENNFDNIELFKMLVYTPVLEDCIPKMIEMISKLRFNKFSGKFKTTDEVDEDLEIGLLFKDFENVSLCFDKCCVCLDYTKSKTCCGHCVCIQCWDKMNDNVCPICRQDMETGHE